MITFEWLDAYSIGDDRIDDQHRSLIRLMNEFYVNHLNGHPAQAQSCLSQLLALTLKHFREEEEMMERMAYPGFHEHRMRHQELLGLVSRLVATYMQSQTGEDAAKLATFLKTWLTRHILGDDKKYGPYLRKAPVGSAGLTRAG